MTKPRSSLVSLTDTPWYHIVSRCVRRAFLCGDDAHACRNYDHRRGWIVERVKQLACVLAIDVAAYAVMSNHYHVVVRIDAERAQGWSREEVLRRWTQLFDGPLALQRRLAGTPALLHRLNIDPEHFIDCATNLMKQFGSAIGAPAHLTELCAGTAGEVSARCGGGQAGV